MSDFVGPIILSVSTRFENIEVIQVVSDMICRMCRLGPEKTYQVGMAMREGVANAMKHGNRFEVSRRVEVRFTESGNVLHVEIEDQGEGFDPGRVEDPLAASNLMKTSGRGILYVKTFMDRHEYQFAPGRGTVLIMEKELPVGDEEAPSPDMGRSET